MNDWAARVERRKLFRRETILLVVRDRYLVQVGSTNRRGGWMTRTVCDTPGEAGAAFNALLDDHLAEGGARLEWDDDLWPDVPDEMFAPRPEDELD